MEVELWDSLWTPALFCVPAGFGCFHPSTHVSGDEDGLLPGKPLHAQQSETGQGDSRWTGRHVWTDARCVTWAHFVPLLS